MLSCKSIFLSNNTKQIQNYFVLYKNTTFRICCYKKVDE